MQPPKKKERNMELDQRELTILNLLETIPYLYREKFSEVIKFLPEKEKKIMTYWYSQTGYLSTEEKSQDNSIMSPEYKKIFCHEKCNSLGNLFQLNAEIMSKNNIIKNELFEVQINYVKELYKTLDEDFNKLKESYYKNKDKRVLKIADLPFLDKKVFTSIMYQLNFYDYCMIINTQKEAIKAQFIKELFNTRQLELVLEDINFSLPASIFNIVKYEEQCAATLMELKPYIQLPDFLIYPTADYLNERISRATELNNKNLHKLEITDILYGDIRDTMRIIRNEAIEDENFYALLYLFRDTELYDKIEICFSNDFLAEAKTYSKNFETKDKKEIEEMTDVIKIVLNKMRNENKITLYCDGLWRTSKGETVYLNSERQVERFNEDEF